MKCINTFLIVVLLLFSNISMGAGSGGKLISSVEVTDTFFTVYFYDARLISETCQEINKVVFWKSDYPNGYNSMLSVALASFASSKKVTMWFSGCKAGPWGATLPKAESIVITNL